MKVFCLLRPLVIQNRWLLFLVMLWPYAMAVMLLLTDRRPAIDDVLAVLTQEALYGMALVGFSAASLLGNEQRSRRIITVLARGVRRSEYLMALLLAAWLPLVLYVAGFTLCACVLVPAAGANLTVVWRAALLQLVMGMWMASSSILFSVFLPSVFASLVSVITASILAYFGWAGPGAVIARLIHLSISESFASILPDISLTLLMAGVVFAAACRLFARRDLDLTTD